MRYSLIPKIKYLLRLLVMLPLAPILYWQGQRIKANIPDLPEAEKNRTGVIGDKIDAINILYLGESSIAGVGVQDHRNGLAGVIAQTIHKHCQRGVNWTVVAKSGFTARQVKEKLLPQIPGQFYDLIVIGLGANDTFQLNSPLKWRSSFLEIVQNLRAKHGSAKIVIANMPPIKWFPAFPPLVRWLMTGQIRLLKKSIEDFPQKLEGVYFLKESIRMVKLKKPNGKIFRHRDLFSDGVHPSKMAYRIWGEQVATYILEKVMVKT